MVASAGLSGGKSARVEKQDARRDLYEAVVATSSIPARYREMVHDLLHAAYAIPQDLDPAAFGRSLAHAGASLARHPGRARAPVGRFLHAAAVAGEAVALKVLGAGARGPLAPPESDRRFEHPAYDENAYFHAVLQTYLGLGQLLAELLEAAELGEAEREKARFALTMILDAVSPANFLLSHPGALQKAFDTRGHSVMRGLKNLSRDLRRNRGWPSKVDTTSFEVGHNMAVTPGKVVYRSELIELIQYVPRTETVHAIPLVCSPAWINKYYIMDLAPGKSFVEWALDHGHSVFMISYRNPDASMREVSFSDYLLDGPVKAIEVVREITGAEKVNVVGVCMGGTLTMALLAYLDAVGKPWVNAATLLNSHTDFTRPGLLGLFFDEKTVEVLDRRSAKVGYLDQRYLTSTFDRLRAHDLVWRYVTSGWLMGEDPPAFDLLAWNGDGTNLPARMQREYLQGCYVDNALARDEMVLGGHRLEVSKVRQDLYVLAAVGDHIVPWESSYHTGQLVAGRVRFVLSTSGHIAGIVNPPNPKAAFWTGEAMPPDARQWLEGATKVRDTWWNDWARWMAERAGPRVPPPPMGSRAHPPIYDAPGEYVRVKA